MIKKILYIVLITGILTNTCSCAFFKKPIDKRTGFSNYLKQTEKYIQKEEWEKAKLSLEDSKKSCKQLKPLLQVDIDHDYVNIIEEYFVKLDGYVEVQEKGNSLATILLVEDAWDNIGSL
jgi:uncharacterized protein YxeA